MSTGNLLGGRARRHIARTGRRVVEYISWASGGESRLWHGDSCGCTDDRCVGYHHDEDEPCGCLPYLLERFVVDVDPSN